MLFHSPNGTGHKESGPGQPEPPHQTEGPGNNNINK